MAPHPSIEQLSRLCRRYGQRFDLTQAAGGNISIKDENFLFIKASGIPLSSVTCENGYSVIFQPVLKADVVMGVYKPIERYSDIRASMETYMHSFLKKYVVHLHPLQVNCILCSKSSEVIIGNLFPNSCYIKYVTPGVELSKEILKEWRGQSLIFLENHGIIITTDTEEEIEPILNKVLDKCEDFNKMDCRLYRQVNQISDIINKQFNTNLISYWAADSTVAILGKHTDLTENLFPDKAVFCKKFLTIAKIEDLENRLELYWSEPPDVIIIGDYCYIVGKSLNHCRDVESILKIHILIKNFISSDQTKRLSWSDTNEIISLDAEKYRKSLT